MRPSTPAGELPPAVPTLLIVCDDSSDRGLAGWILRHDFGAVLEAAMAEDGACLAERERPDVVQLDMDLPGQDGVATCKQMRAAAPPRRTPIVMLTARRRGVSAQGDERGRFRLSGGAGRAGPVSGTLARTADAHPAHGSDPHGVASRSAREARRNEGVRRVRLLRLAREEAAFVYLAGGGQPNDRTLARFRRDNAAGFTAVFQQTVVLALRLGLARTCPGERRRIGVADQDTVE